MISIMITIGFRDAYELVPQNQIGTVGKQVQFVLVLGRFTAGTLYITNRF